VLTVRPDAQIGHDGSAGLRSFAEDAARAGALVRHHRGVRSIEVARIVGSVDRSHELGPDFKRRGPLRLGSMEERRFQGVVDATRNGVTLPPISVFQIGFGYYVEDGHHRVAAAKINGQTEIDADVTEFVTVDVERTPELAVARSSFERTTGLLDLGATRAESYVVLGQAIERFAHEERIDDLSYAARRWERVVYRPLWAEVRARELSTIFPGDRTADTIARIAAVHLHSGADWHAAVEHLTSDTVMSGLDDRGVLPDRAAARSAGADAHANAAPAQVDAQRHTTANGDEHTESHADADATANTDADPDAD